MPEVIDRQANLSGTKTIEKPLPSFQSNEIVEKFKAITRNYALFHLVSFGIFFIEILLFLFLFPKFARSSVIAFFLAGILLSGFSYFVLLFYFQAKKPQQFIQLRKTFQKSYGSTYKNAHPLYLAHASEEIGLQLHNQEFHHHPFFNYFPTMKTLIKKWTTFLHWKDVLYIKEQFFFLSIDEHHEEIKNTPTDLEIHASLAQTYNILAKLYKEPHQLISESTNWMPQGYFSEEINQKFKAATQRAIEELKILDAYSPDDPWVHVQLAGLYHNLEMPTEEILEYEKILSVAPNDQHILYQLGKLYFLQGSNARGLKVYEQLKSLKSNCCEDLISYYATSRENALFTL